MSNVLSPHLKGVEDVGVEKIFLW